VWLLLLGYDWVLALALLVNGLVLTCHGYEGCVSVRERERERGVSMCRGLYVSMSLSVCACVHLSHCVHVCVQMCCV
jgi:hypothetical protein